MELVFGIFAVLSLFAVMVSKYLVSLRLQNMRQKVIESEVSARAAQGKLKQVESNSGVAERGIKAKARKRQLLERQIKKLKNDLAELKP